MSICGHNGNNGTFITRVIGRVIACPPLGRLRFLIRIVNIRLSRGFESKYWKLYGFECFHIRILIVHRSYYDEKKYKIKSMIKMHRMKISSSILKILQVESIKIHRYITSKVDAR